MKPQMGRPKSDNPKNVDLKVRIDKKTNERLLLYCDKKGITRTQAIREGIYLILGEKE